MGKMSELHADAVRLGPVVERIVRDINPEGFIEYQLRQSISDAIKELGKEKVREIFKEAAE